MKPVIIAKYRRVHWIFSVYSGIEFIEIYKIAPEDLESYYIKGGKNLYAVGKKDINNPKIPPSQVRKAGTLLYEIKEVLKDA